LKRCARARPAAVEGRGKLLLLLLLLAPRAEAEALLVFAAASLKGALDEAVMVFEAESGHRVSVSYGGSSLLARQLEQGAPADVFISADVAWMDQLASSRLIDETTRVNLLGNELVLIAHASDGVSVELGSGGGEASIADKLGSGRLAMAYVDAVPAGRYGKTALETLGLWEGLANRVAQTDNVRTALALVAAAEARFGIVYATDAAADPRVRVLAAFPAGSYGPIVYPAAAVSGGRGAAARDLLRFLEAPAARGIFARHGFQIAEG
jgi:molybdate transport system substrate-binding protein